MSLITKSSYYQNLYVFWMGLSTTIHNWNNGQQIFNLKKLLLSKKHCLFLIKRNYGKQTTRGWEKNLHYIIHIYIKFQVIRWEFQLVGTGFGTFFTDQNYLILVSLIGGRSQITLCTFYYFLTTHPPMVLFSNNFTK